MYAVIECGGKQLKVEPGQMAVVERLPVDVGEVVEIDKVLLAVDGDTRKVGRPYVEGAKVRARVLEHVRGKKIRVLKFKPKKRYKKVQGHRQALSRIMVEEVIA